MIQNRICRLLCIFHRLFTEIILCTDQRLFPSFINLFIASVRLQDVCLQIISKLDIQNMFCLLFDLFIF